MPIIGWRSVPLVLILSGLPAGCARDPVATETAVGAVPTSPGPAVTPLKISVLCGGPYRVGQYVPLACVIMVEEGTNPASIATSAFADKRIFDGLAESSVPRCPACGFPPRVFDLDLTVPAALTPGVKTFAVWATDAQGRRAETTGSIEVVAR